jgi:hypothetical protein
MKVMLTIGNSVGKQVAPAQQKDSPAVYDKRGAEASASGVTSLRRGQAGFNCRANLDDAAGQGIRLPKRQLPVAPQGGLDLVGHASDINCSDGARPTFQGVGCIDAAGKLAVSGNNWSKLLALLAEQGKNVPLQFEIAEGLPRKMLRIKHPAT